MANSDFLRQNKNQHSIKNSISKVMDSDVDLAVQNMISLLKKEYPDLTFEHTKKLSLTKIIADLSAQYPQFEKEHWIVDIGAAKLADNPCNFDVVVLPNLYGDILSDLGAGLVGGLGLAPSGNIGAQASVFEAVHGAAPDIAGQGLANPTALLFSATLMLRHIGQVGVAERVEKAVLKTFAAHRFLTKDIGGSASTMEFADAVCQNLE